MKYDHFLIYIEVFLQNSVYSKTTQKTLWFLHVPGVRLLARIILDGFSST